MVVRKTQIADTSEPIIQTTQSCVRSCSHSCWHIFLAIVLVLSLLMNAASLYFLSGNSYAVHGDTVGIKKALLELEYDKVGGQKNYETIQKYSQLQLKEQIPQIEQYVNSAGSGTTPSPTTQADQTTQPSGWTLSQEDIANLKKGAAIEGNANANILVIEYSDMECPFCMKQYHDTNLAPKLKTQYGDKLAFIFKNNKGVNHPGTTVKALSALCVQKISGNDTYVKYYHAIMDASTNEGGVYDVSKLGTLAKSLGLDQKVFQSCVDTKEADSVFAAQTAEAQKFGLSGTPGTLIINTTTGKYDTVEGAYPYDTFTTKIEALLK